MTISAAAVALQSGLQFGELKSSPGVGGPVTCWFRSPHTLWPFYFLCFQSSVGLSNEFLIIWSNEIQMLNPNSLIFFPPLLVATNQLIGLRFSLDCCPAAARPAQHINLPTVYTTNPLIPNQQVSPLEPTLSSVSQNCRMNTILTSKTEYT